MSILLFCYRIFGRTGYSVSIAWVIRGIMAFVTIHTIVEFLVSTVPFYKLCSC
jgi:hypothetical protein